MATMYGRSFALLMLACALATNAVSAVEVHPPLENAITRALQKKTAVDFQETPLREAIAQVARIAGVPVLWDDSALQDEGIASDSLVTLTAKEQPVAEILSALLRPLQMEFDPRGEVLLVTTPGKMDETLSERHFDVSQLVELIKPRLESMAVRPISPFGIGSTSVPDTKTTGPSGEAAATNGFGDSTAEYQQSPFPTRLTPAQHRFPAEYCLMGIIQENTSGQWDDIDGVGGTITSSPGRIRIRQTENVHREVYGVLAALEQFLRDPKKSPQFRLHENADDRQRRAALEEIFATISVAPASTIPLQKWLDENLTARGIDVVVDPAALSDEGVNWPEIMIDLVPQVSRRRLFEAAMRRAQLKLIYEDDVYKITAGGGCEWPNSTMLFDVSDVPEAGDLEWLSEYLFTTTSGQWEAVDGVGGTLSTCGIRGLLFVRHDERVLKEVVQRLDDLRLPLEVPGKPLQPQRIRSIYTLPDVQTATDLQAVLPILVDHSDAIWLADAIQRVGPLLIVKQTEAVQRRIETVIDAIRKAHGVTTPTQP